MLERAREFLSPEQLEARTAEGAELDALAADRFGLTRKAATPAVGEVQFTRGSSTGTVVIPAGTRVEGEVDGDKLQFTTDTPVELAAGSSSVLATATCTVAGRDGNVAAGVIDTLLDTIPADPDLTVTNPERFAGGAEQETDEAFRDRIRRYFGTLRKGTAEALVEGALSVPGVEFAVVDESFIAPEDGGFTAVYIGDPDAQANATMADLVAAELDRWRAAGVRVQVTAAERELVSLTLQVWIERGADTTTLLDQVRAAVLAYVDGLEPGETMRLARVEAAAITASPDVVSAEVTSPTSDPVPSAPHKALRVDESNLTVAFTEV